MAHSLFRCFLLVMTANLLLVLTGYQAYSQTPVKLPFETFPLVGFQTGGDPLTDSGVARMKRAWMNGVYGGSMGKSTSVNGGMQSLIAWPTDFGYIGSDDTNLNPPRIFITSHRAPYDNLEARWFLTANEDKLTEHSGTAPSLDNTDLAPDLLHRWDTVSGSFNSSTGEWLILRTDSISTSPGKYLLKNLTPISVVDDVNRNDSIHCSFIYRLGSDTGSFGTTPLFELEYYAHYNDTVLHKDTVFLADYSFISSWEYNTFIRGSHPSENDRILRFPGDAAMYNASRSLSYTRQKYAVHYHNISNHHPNWVFQRVLDVWVKKLKSVDIFVRGLRQRSDFAEKILTDDPATVAEINRLADSLKNSVSSSIWKNVAYIDCSSEPFPGSFRAIAHIDAIVSKRIGKHIVPYLADNYWNQASWDLLWDQGRYSYYRAIYEDETGQRSPPINAQGLLYFSSREAATVRRTLLVSQF